MDANTAEDDWVRLALPVFDASCTTCHASGPFGFLAGADAQAIRKTLLDWQPRVVDIGFPVMSPILTKGLHANASAPALAAEQTSNLLTWMRHERESAGIPETIRIGAFGLQMCTDQMPPITCPNNWLSFYDIQGAIEFVARPDTDGILIGNLAYVAGDPPAELIHPRFIALTPNGEITDNQLAPLVIRQSGFIGAGEVRLSTDFVGAQLVFEFETP